VGKKIVLSKEGNGRPRILRSGGASIKETPIPDSARAGCSGIVYWKSQNIGRKRLQMRFLKKKKRFTMFFVAWDHCPERAMFITLVAKGTPADCPTGQLVPVPEYEICLTPFKPADFPYSLLLRRDQVLVLCASTSAIYNSGNDSLIASALYGIPTIVKPISPYDMQQVRALNCDIVHRRCC